MPRLQAESRLLSVSLLLSPFPSPNRVGQCQDSTTRMRNQLKTERPIYTVFARACSATRLNRTSRRPSLTRFCSGRHRHLRQCTTAVIGDAAGVDSSDLARPCCRWGTAPTLLLIRDWNVGRRRARTPFPLALACPRHSNRERGTRSASCNR